MIYCVIGVSFILVSRLIYMKVMSHIYAEYRIDKIKDMRLTVNQIKTKLALKLDIYIENTTMGYRIILKPVDDFSCIIENARNGKATLIHCKRTLLEEINSVIDSNQGFFCYNISALKSSC